MVRRLASVEVMYSDSCTTEADTRPEEVTQLVSSIIQEDLLYTLASTLQFLPFESRKDTQTIFSYVLRYKPPMNDSPVPPVIEYIVNRRPEVIIQLCRGYSNKESVMPCGVILREALKHEDVAIIILYDRGGEERFNIDNINENTLSSSDGVFWDFFYWIDKGSFETSADAFTTFRVCSSRTVNLSKRNRIDKTIGDHHQAQKRGITFLSSELRPVLLKVPHRASTVQLVRDEAAVDQATWRNPSRPSELQCHDELRRPGGPLEDVHESTQR
jgi:hypothetical protein